MPDDSRDSAWREVLPLVVDAAAKSAEASTAAANSISSFEVRLSSLEDSVKVCGDKLAALVALEDDRKQREAERSAWARSIFTPQFIAYMVMILLGIAGIRISLPAQVTVPSVTSSETDR